MKPLDKSNFEYQLLALDVKGHPRIVLEKASEKANVTSALKLFGIQWRWSGNDAIFSLYIPLQLQPHYMGSAPSSAMSIWTLTTAELLLLPPAPGGSTPVWQGALYSLELGHWLSTQVVMITCKMYHSFMRSYLQCASRPIFTRQIGLVLGIHIHWRIYSIFIFKEQPYHASFYDLGMYICGGPEP